MLHRAAALVALALAACGTEADPHEPPAPPSAQSIAIAGAKAAYERWRAIPPPADAETFDPDALEWRIIPGMEQLAREGAPRVTIVARAGAGGSGCGGGVCSTPLDTRVLRGTPPSDELGYFASMRPPNDHLCEGGSTRGLFTDWAIAEIAPLSDEEHRLDCGIHFWRGRDLVDWVIVRVSTGRRVR